MGCYAIPQQLRFFRPSSFCCLHSPYNIIVWSACSIYHICLPDVMKSSFSEYWPLHCVLTLLLGKMLDVGRYGQYGGNLRPLCQGWYVWSTGTKENLCFDCHETGNSYANHKIRLGFEHMFYVRFRGNIETNITRYSFCRRICCLCLRNMRFQLLFMSIYLIKQTHSTGLTNWQLRDSLKPLQPAALYSRIHL